MDTQTGTGFVERARHPVLAPMVWDPGILSHVHASRPQVDIDAADLVSRRSIKGDSQVEADLRLVGLIDDTTLKGGDTPGNVRRLCRKALAPVPSGVLAKLGYNEPLTVGGVCVYRQQVPVAVAALYGRVPVAAVSTDFPHGQNSSLEERCAQIRGAVEAGAAEIDVVIRRGLALCERWRELYDELVAFREVCGQAHLKVILGVGDLADYQIIAKAACVAMMAGADFIKTSTGMEKVNATLPVGLVMLRMIRWFYTEVDPGRMVGFKPAGGIGKAAQARAWFVLMNEELGTLDPSWLEPRLFRIGASTLLDDLIAQLTTNADGGGDKYADYTEIPIG